MTPSLLNVEIRARQSIGISNDPMVYLAVADAVTQRHSGGGILYRRRLRDRQLVELPPIPVRQIRWGSM